MSNLDKDGVGFYVKLRQRWGWGLRGRVRHISIFVLEVQLFEQKVTWKSWYEKG